MIFMRPFPSFQAAASVSKHVDPSAVNTNSTQLAPSNVPPTITTPTANVGGVSAAQVKRKSSLEDFESEIEALNLDDNIDTSVSMK